MAIEKFVVVGASLAGLRAVEAARKSGFEGSITLIGAEPHLPYDRPPLSKEFLAPLEDGRDREPPYFREREHLVDELGVELMLGEPATGLDPERKVVLIGDREIPFDAMVIATGADARTISKSGWRSARSVAARISVDSSRAGWLSGSTPTAPGPWKESW